MRDRPQSLELRIETKRGDRFKEDSSKKFFGKDGFTVLKLKGYTPAADFSSPDYSIARESHQNPDYRSTLYWNPSLETDPDSDTVKFAFYAADLVTTYKVVIEGVTQDNTPFREVKYINIKP